MNRALLPTFAAGIMGGTMLSGYLFANSAVSVQEHLAAPGWAVILGGLTLLVLSARDLSNGRLRKRTQRGARTK